MNKRIELYTIIEASSTDGLIDLVQDSIQNNGWQPLGGIVVSNNRFYQVMIKYELSA